MYVSSKTEIEKCFLFDLNKPENKISHKTTVFKQVILFCLYNVCQLCTGVPLFAL